MECSLAAHRKGASESLAGLGIAPVKPVILSRGGNRSDSSPQRAATILSIMGYAGLLVVPPSILAGGEYWPVHGPFPLRKRIISNCKNCLAL